MVSLDTGCVSCGSVRRIGQPREETRDRKALLIALLEEALGHSARTVQNEGPGVRDPKNTAPWICLPVEQVVASDDLGPFVGQHGKLDVTRIGERLDGLGRVIQDRHQPQSTAFDLVESALQLHELRLAVRSPIGRTAEYQHQTIRPHQGL